MVSLVASARVHGFEKVAVTLFFAPHALAREPIEQKTWKLECPSALPCFIFPQNLTKFVGSVQLLCNSLEIEAIKRPMRTSIHFIHYPVLIKENKHVVTRSHSQTNFVDRGAVVDEGWINVFKDNIILDHMIIKYQVWREISACLPDNW